MCVCFCVNQNICLLPAGPDFCGLDDIFNFLKTAAHRFLRPLLSLRRSLSSVGIMASKPAKVESNSSSDDEATSGPSRVSDAKDDSTIEMIRRYMADKLGFLDSEEKSHQKVLEELTLDGVVKHIKDGKVKRIITMAGAGISTSAGIPDFRSPESGLYNNLEKYNLPHPQAVFEIDFFQENPKPFFLLAKELYPGSFKPTICHYFIKLLNEKGMLLRHYTQNIDTLERVAGVPGEVLIEAHGTFYTSHCLECRAEYELEWMKERIFSDQIPICEKCPGVVKPDIVFFGENLPDRFYSSISKDFDEADLLIVMGSSLVVQPFASLVNKVKHDCPRLLINREKAGEGDRLMALLGMGGGMDFSDKSTRDVAWLGDCDDGCQLLADKLGWGDELRKLVKEEHERIDKEKESETKAEGKGAKP
ncbi:NAD-dependent protein deacetylase sirtuin-2 isoform X1 [Thrips palmi]|uniref:NAD-dependent protein deacetylase sirtuin-2 isoform X1 n=2 Tax=Thrips palmi TaxID=161013 RepID=A0A6P8Y8T4_THRPL|nr:NAD-dependent protein deacetylase sirtuin-2 isoform X1 [Thrips palmi]